MTKIEELKIAKNAGMKSRNSTITNILSLLHSDALNLAKKEKREVTDDDVISSAKSLIKKNNQAMDLAMEKTGITIPKLSTENMILEAFLPAQISKEEMEKFIDEIIDSLPEEAKTRKSQGIIMKQLKEKYGNSVNMGTASKYVGTKLS